MSFTYIWQVSDGKIYFVTHTSFVSLYVPQRLLWFSVLRIYQVFWKAFENTFLTWVLVLILVRRGCVLTAIVTFHMLHSLSVLPITFTVNDVLATLSLVSLDSFLLSPTHEHSATFCFRTIGCSTLIFIFNGMNSFTTMLLQENNFKPERKLGEFVTVCLFQGASLQSPLFPFIFVL